MTEITSSIDKTEDSLINDEINVNLLFKFLNRNKKKISIISFLFFVLACLFSFTLKRIWAGEFQIVLNSGQSSQRANIGINSPLMDLFDNDFNNLNTEVGILESPSILIPIYQYVIANKKFDSKKNKLLFNQWEKQLKIELEKNTSILNIVYEDSDKELIVPVLEKISSAYQDYSQKSVKRSQEISKKFLSDQIEIFKKKSSESLKIVQEYALDQDLIFFDSVNNITNTNLDKTILMSKENIELANQDQLLRSNTGIIRARINAANNIRRIDEQIKKINELGDDVEKLQYIGSTIPRLKQEGLPDALANLQTQLAQRNVNYSANDISILEIIKEREVLVNLIKKRAIGYLKAEKLESQAIVKALMRPKGVLLKYKELVRNAGRDESTLISLESQLRAIELEEARVADPWELITNPTLSPIPVGPSRRKIGIIGLFLGFLFGSGYFFYKEKKSDIIHDLDSLSSILSTELIGSISESNIDFSDPKFAYLFEYINKRDWDKLTLIAIGDLQKQKMIDICNNLVPKNKDKKDINLVFSLKELKSYTNTDLKIICVSLGKLTFGQLKEFKKYFDLYDYDIDGILLIDNGCNY